MSAIPFVCFASLLLATGALRLVEVWVSAKRAQARPTSVVAEPWLFPLMVLLHIGLIGLPIAEVLYFDRPYRPLLWAFAGLLFLSATALRIWTLRTIGLAWNVRVVKPDNDQIAQTGPYAWIRHPNYLVVIIEIIALPLFHGAWLSLLGLSALNALVLTHRIRTEEATLMQLPKWSAHFKDRSRLIPGVF